MVTRRCAQRIHRFRPCAETNDIFCYGLALAAAKTGVLIHAVCLMSNHHHLVVTDVEGRMPDFTRELHRSTAKAINASQGQAESVWSAERCHLLELGDEDDVLEKIAYLAANPVEAGLVESPEEWPGVLFIPSDEVRVIRVRRPKAYFGEDSAAPEEIELWIVPPPRIANLAARVAAAVHARVAAARTKMREAGWNFLGRAAVLATSFVGRAKSFEKTRQLVPQIGAIRPDLRRTLLAAQRAFRQAYHDALDRWRDGLRSVVFPLGTWWMKVFHGAAVAAPD
jgi:REP element-mobilizing transposase RayT